MSQPQVMILAGEASGDAHAAEFVEQLRPLCPQINLTGMGGDNMREAGVKVFYDASDIAVVGLVEVITHWGAIRQAMKQVRQAMTDQPPDLLVLVDYPGFNLKMAQYARTLGIPVLFYISPQIWAWRPRRIHKIGTLVDHMAVIFPFEVEYYQNANIPVTFVGNQLVDRVQSSQSAKETRAQLGIDPETSVVGLFPGSRKSELTHLLPLMLETAQSMTKQDPNLTFVIAVANTLDYDLIEQQCQASGLKVFLTCDQIYNVITCCDVIISCSGTVTLEIALLQIPLCIVYRMSRLSYWILQHLITVPYVGLANIVAGAPIVRELIQQDATVENISTETFKILQNSEYRYQIKQGLAQTKDRLGSGNGAQNMAQLILTMLGDRVRSGASES